MNNKPIVETKNLSNDWSKNKKKHPKSSGFVRKSHHLQIICFRLQSIAIEPAPTPRRLVKLLDREVRRRDPDGELELVSVPDNLHDVEPQEENFHLHAGELRELVLRYDAGDGRFVIQLVRALEGEATRLVEIRVELPRGFVQIVRQDSFGENPDGEVVALEEGVRRRQIAVCSCGGERNAEEEEKRGG
ncbi:hypothetical protein Bca4012_069585 [Brassica carinata]